LFQEFETEKYRDALIWFQELEIERRRHRELVAGVRVRDTANYFQTERNIDAVSYFQELKAERDRDTVR
jgi:hypothetical protein